MVDIQLESVARFVPHWPCTDTEDPVMVRLLDAAGHRVADADFSWRDDAAMAVPMLRELVLARRFDVEATALQRKGELGLWAPMLGQEAIQVGIHHALQPVDYVFPSYREHALALLSGLPIASLLGLFRGTEMGDWDCSRLRFANYTMVIGDQVLHATGYAMASQWDAEPDPTAPRGATVVFHGDGATSEGDVNEAYLFAAAHQAPIVFVCTNNQWAISAPTGVQSRVGLYQRAWGFGIPSVRVDGNDVLAVQEVAKWALQRARSGAGPTMIEAYTYRMGAHTTSDDPTKYRSNQLTESWAKRDPIDRLRTWLRAEGAWDDAAQADLDQEAERFGAQVRQVCLGLAEPVLGEVFNCVYAEPHPDMIAQADQWRAYLAGFEEV